MTESPPSLDDPLSAFCKDTNAYLAGAAEGPLSGLSFAAKDIFDVAGHITTQYVQPWFEESIQQAKEVGLALQETPVPVIDGGSMNLYQDLVILGCRLVDLLEPQLLG